MDKIREEFEKRYPKPLILDYDEDKKEYIESIRSPMSLISMTIYNAQFEVYKSRDKEVQRLNDLTDNMLLLITKHGIQQSEEIIEALKDGE